MNNTVMNKIRFLILLPNGVYYHQRFLHMPFFVVCAFFNEMCYHIFWFNIVRPSILEIYACKQSFGKNCFK